MNPSISGDGAKLWAGISEVNRALFQLCVENARACGDAGNWEDLLQWGSVAAASASGQGWFGTLSSRELEEELVRAAQALPRPAVTRRTGSRPRWLHVFTEAYATLGHTNLCRRWIQFDADVTHDVITLSQRGPIPENLVAAVTASGGRCVGLEATEPLFCRAAELRAYAWTHSDVVVLHTHPDEVAGVVAFGIEGGPVVLVMNHADHVFWLGCSVADAVLEIRQSGLDWTRQLRGVNRSHILPIPLAESVAAARDGESLKAERSQLRQQFGIPEQALLLLTVGSASKYEPFEQLNFIASAKRILTHQPDAYLIAVGPKDTGIWAEAKAATNGRLMAVGHQPDSTVFCRAADLYVEGFPLGSLTALLEAGQEGLMIVRAPLESPLPFCSDSVSLAALRQPRDLDDYVQTALRLMREAVERRTGGVSLQNAIKSQHCGFGWLARLREIRSQLPQGHSIQLDFRSQPAPAAVRDWYLRYTHRKTSAPTLQDCVGRVYREAWKRTAGQPRIDAGLWRKLSAGDHWDDSGDGVSRFELAEFNRELAREGKRLRYLHRANIAWRNGRNWLALRSVYSCLVTVPSSLSQRDFWKMFFQAHLKRGFIQKLKAWY